MLFNLVRPGKSPTATRQQAVRKGEPNADVRTALYSWRRSVKREHYRSALWGPQALLDDETCELLSSVGPFDDQRKLQTLLQSRWSRWDELGQCLFDHLHALDIPPLPAPKRRIRHAPDQHTGLLSPNSHYQPSAAKRIRLQEAPDDSDDGSDTPLQLTSAYPASSRILSPPALASHTIASQEPSGPVVNARAPLAHLCRPLNPAVRRRSPPLDRQPSLHHQNSYTARQDTQTYRSPDMYPPLQVPTPIIPLTIERTEPAERPDVPANTRPHSVVHTPQCEIQ